MEFNAIRNGWLECDKGFVTLGRGMGTKVKIPVYCYLVKHKNGNVLVDTGFSAEFKRTWGKRLKYFMPIIENDIVSELKNSNIKFIVNTHLHIDHAENNGAFKGAEIIVQKEEIDAAFTPKSYQKLAYPDSTSKTLNYKIIKGDFDLFKDGAVKIIRTAGHTPGHQSVLLDVNGRKIFIAGDACYTSENLKYYCLPAILWNPDKMMKCYEMIRNLKDTSVIFGHEELSRDLLHVS